MHLEGDDDEPGALTTIFDTLARAGVAVNESSGIASIHRRYGVILSLEHDDCETAIAVLGA